MLVTKPESGMQPKITASENRAVNKDFLFENSLCVIFPFPVHFVYKLSISVERDFEFFKTVDKT